MKPHSRTWQGQDSFDSVSLQSLLDSCFVNVRKVAQEEAALRELRRRLPAGDPRLVGTKDEPSVGYKITRARHEQEHWREYQRYYTQRIASEGRDAMVRIPVTRRMVERAKAEPQPDPRLPPEREVGGDDDELPF